MFQNNFMNNHENTRQTVNKPFSVNNSTIKFSNKENINTGEQNFCLKTSIFPFNSTSNTPMGNHKFKEKATSPVKVNNFRIQGDVNSSHAKTDFKINFRMEDKENSKVGFTVNSEGKRERSQSNDNFGSTLSNFNSHINKSSNLNDNNQINFSNNKINFGAANGVNNSFNLNNNNLHNNKLNNPFLNSTVINNSSNVRTSNPVNNFKISNILEKYDNSKISTTPEADSKREFIKDLGIKTSTVKKPCLTQSESRIFLNSLSKFSKKNYLNSNTITNSEITSNSGLNSNNSLSGGLNSFLNGSGYFNSSLSPGYTISSNSITSNNPFLSSGFFSVVSNVSNVNGIPYNFSHNYTNPYASTRVNSFSTFNNSYASNSNLNSNINFFGSENNYIPIAETENETEESQNFYTESEPDESLKEYEKKLLIPKEKKNDEAYKLLKINKNLKKPEIAANKSARRFTDFKKIDNGELDDPFNFNILKKKKKVHSVKKLFVSEMKMFNENRREIKTFKIFRDCEIGINMYWQSHIISAEDDHDVETDNEQITIAKHYIERELLTAAGEIKEGKNVLLNPGILAEIDSNDQ